MSGGGRSYMMNHHLHLQLIRSKKRRKTLSLCVKADGRIVLSVPYQTPQREIERFILEKERWILQKTSESKRRRQEIDRSWAPGETFLYLGESYPLEIQHSGTQEPGLRFSFGSFFLCHASLRNAKELFIEWYKRKAREIIPFRVNHYSHQLHLYPQSVRISSAQSRWGSCSGDNRLSFSWRIILAPLSVIDYVLLHELVHIREKNHSRKFWNYLESILPNYKSQRLWLRENGHRLSV